MWTYSTCAAPYGGFKTFCSRVMVKWHATSVDDDMYTAVYVVQIRIRIVKKFSALETFFGLSDLSQRSKKHHIPI